MPRKATKPCKHPGCVHTRPCPDHDGPENNQIKSKKWGNTKSQKFYNTGEWRRFSKYLRVKRPVCEICKSQLSKVVHHTKPYNRRPDLAFDEENCICICHQCHLKIENPNPKQRGKTDE